MIGLIVALDAEFEAGVVARLGEVPDLTVIARPADEAELLALAAAGEGQVVLLGRYFPGLDADVVRGLKHTGVHILAMGQEADFRGWDLPVAGLDLPVADLAARIRSSAASVVAPPRPAQKPAEARRTGTIIAVWGTAGAPGRSTVAAALAQRLSLVGETVLCDADTVAASQAVLFGVLDEAPQIAALCRLMRSGRPAPEAVSAQLSSVAPGLRLITGMSRADRWQEVGPGVLGEVLEELRAHAAVTVVDVSDRLDGEEFDPHSDRHGATRAVLAAADHVLVLGNADPLGLLRLVNLVTSDDFAQLTDRATIVVNKVRESAVGPDPQSVVSATLSRFVGVRQYCFLPAAGEDLDRALLAGRSIGEAAPHSAFVEAIDALLTEMPGLPRPATRRRSLRGVRKGRGRRRRVARL
ncbi:hypothetical protein NQ038_01950 [Brevibacterium sp. 50QC2O2]|uniref:AAA family ATPase n=1 Tax=Brevibacterium TaxID=1696 RepID=UPI00211BAFCB|nr:MULTISPECIES: hypothetical protein [unclassified Brevibacterium]MCQ9368499.1 hypothetical protein [Brevibacterium sp. 91QC2O2]MCQ9385921.1 hypothetical protein [Brevibacterium sp. 68QC2CO]MCQ9387413.1 hypothetical protein [Brevibacterium sp. 50QC2O2]